MTHSLSIILFFSVFANLFAQSGHIEKIDQVSKSTIKNDSCTGENLKVQIAFNSSATVLDTTTTGCDSVKISSGDQNYYSRAEASNRSAAITGTYFNTDSAGIDYDMEFRYFSNLTFDHSNHQLLLDSIDIKLANTNSESIFSRIYLIAYIIQDSVVSGEPAYKNIFWNSSIVLNNTMLQLDGNFSPEIILEYQINKTIATANNVSVLVPVPTDIDLNDVLFEVSGSNIKALTTNKRLLSERQFEQHLMFNIFPNPASTFIRIDLPFEEIAEIEILDLKGVVLQKEKTHLLNNKIDISHLNPGFYLVRITDIQENKSIGIYT
jgi:hypothetical protein